MTARSMTDFRGVLKQLAIEYKRRADGGVSDASPLRRQGRSIFIYLHDATRDRGPYFAFNPRQYEGYLWRGLWQTVPVARADDHVKYLPIPGKEREALENAIAFLDRGRARTRAS